MTEGYIHLAKSEFTQQEHGDDCPAKDDSELSGGYGMAGGGMGAYEVCNCCCAIRSKVLDHDDEA